jgi:hypothetical protein
MATVYVSDATKAALPERHPTDHYPTPRGLVEAAVNRILIPGRAQRVLDPGAGTGVWGEVWRERDEEAFITGVELLPTFKRPPAYDDWLIGDFLGWTPPFLYDVVLGNPPYGKLAEGFIRKSVECLRDGGRMLFLLRTEFQNSERRARGIFTDFPPHSIFPLAQRPSFTGDGKTQPQDYTLFYWVKGHTGTARWSTFDWRD